MPEKRLDFSGSVIIFFILLFVYSKWGPAVPFSTITQGRGEPMAVSATGKSYVTPDLALVSAGIEASGTSLKQVQESVNTKSQSLVKSLKSLGIDEKDIRTSSYNVYPQNNYDNNPPTITGYSVSTSYQIKIRDLDMVNEILTTLTQNGANIVGGVSFEVSDDIKNEKMNEARKEAADLAKEKAKGLAKASGITLGKIINVSESQGDNFPRPVAMLEKADVTSSEPIQPDIQPGESEISVTVTLYYEIK